MIEGATGPCDARSFMATHTVALPALRVIERRSSDQADRTKIRVATVAFQRRRAVSEVRASKGNA